MRNTFVFVELSHNTFTFFHDVILFLMLQNYLNIFLFYDPFFGCACGTRIVTIFLCTIKELHVLYVSLYDPLPTLISALI
jgi:hypothetical protein